MKFNNTENKCYETTCGQQVWKSRNVAVCVEVLRVDPNDSSKLEILAVLRGDKLYQPGLWCLPCGYLDWDETVYQAAQREVFEETGIKLDLADLDIYQIDSDPNKALQNVTIHFRAYLLENNQVPSVINDEVKESKWISLKNYIDYSCAFDHDKRVSNIIQNG